MAVVVVRSQVPPAGYYFAVLQLGSLGGRLCVRINHRKPGFWLGFGRWDFRWNPAAEIWLEPRSQDFGWNLAARIWVGIHQPRFLLESSNWDVGWNPAAGILVKKFRTPELPDLFVQIEGS